MEEEIKVGHFTSMIFFSILPASEYIAQISILELNQSMIIFLFHGGQGEDVEREVLNLL
jgi:hypothetical protein